MKYYLAVGFGLMCIAQWYVPASMIMEQEDILASGTIYRFKTAPVDPNDPFRGKYITLNFEAETFVSESARQWDGDQEAYVILREDKDGFAAVAEITDTLPEGDQDFFLARVRYTDNDKVELRFPFDRFYLEESKAPAAEETYAESNRADEGTDTYAVVRIKDGQAALQDVRIGDRSIVDIVREKQGRGDE